GGAGVRRRAAGEVPGATPVGVPREPAEDADAAGGEVQAARAIRRRPADGGVESIGWDDGRGWCPAARDRAPRDRTEDDESADDRAAARPLAEQKKDPDRVRDRLEHADQRRF